MGTRLIHTDLPVTQLLSNGEACNSSQIILVTQRLLGTLHMKTLNGSLQHVFLLFLAYPFRGVMHSASCKNSVAGTMIHCCWTGNRARIKSGWPIMVIL